MLVLTRKKDESIMVGEDIEIVVVEIAPNQVRLGIKAPKDTEVFRKEIFLAIKEENKKSVFNSANANRHKDALKSLFKD